MMFMGMAPIGSYSAGLAAHRVGAPLTLAVGGALSLCGGAFFSLYLPKLRVEARKLILAQESSGAEPPALQPVVASDSDVEVMEESLTLGAEERPS